MLVFYQRYDTDGTSRIREGTLAIRLTLEKGSFVFEFEYDGALASTTMLILSENPLFLNNKKSSFTQ